MAALCLVPLSLMLLIYPDSSEAEHWAQGLEGRVVRAGVCTCPSYMVQGLRVT